MANPIRSLSLDADHSRVHLTVDGREYCLMLTKEHGRLRVDDTIGAYGAGHGIEHLYEDIEEEVHRLIAEDREPSDEDIERDRERTYDMNAREQRIREGSH